MGLSLGAAPRIDREAVRRSVLVPLVLMAAALAGCSAHIGSSCTLSTDCSPQGDRICDTSQPGGYCTQLNCNGISCPDNAACVSFESSVPGCPNVPYSDYGQPSRTALSSCMQTCGSDSDCRGGYICRDPKGAPWYGAILNDTQNLHVCIAVATAVPNVSLDDGSVCLPHPPPIPSDAAGAAEAGAEDGGDGGSADGGGDATLQDASEQDVAGEASPDSGEGGADAGPEGGTDAAPVDGASAG